MKVNIDILTPAKIAGIKKWLKLSRENKSDSCPMPSPTKIKCNQSSDRYCRFLFPETNKTTWCPCSTYSLKYVTRRAKYFIKKWEEKNK